MQLPKSQFQVRPPRLEDADALGALHNLVWRHAYAGLMPESYLAALNDVSRSQQWHATLSGLDSDGLAADGRQTLVASDGKRLLGFVTAGPARREEHAGTQELMALYVHPDWQGKGVAQALVRSVLINTPTMLWVLEGNVRAIKFYTRLGFESRDVYLIHEGTGKRECLMVRDAVSNEETGAVA